MRALKGKKKIRRRGSSTNRKLYFSKETQESILSYQLSETREEKEALYVEKIFPAFDKLVENLIFVYGFITPQENYITLKNDCVSFLYETLGKWDSSRGTKAFSYFNVVAKNWLLMNARKNRKSMTRHVSLSDPMSLSVVDVQKLSNHDVVPPPDEILIKRNVRKDILMILYKIKERIRGEKEAACIDAVITVFQNIDQLDFLNKRAVFVYVRDISGLNPKQLSVAMSSIRKYYRELVKTDKYGLKGILW